MADKRAFSRLIASWHRSLAGALPAAAPGDAAERAITRCLFVRLGENRGLLPIGTLAALADGTRLDERLCALQRRITGASGALDDRDPGAEFGDAPLRAILARLATTGPPDHFESLPLASLGLAHEQLRGLASHASLGRPNGGARGTARKTGGIYYTPPAIVDYLAQRTVGALLAEQDRATVATLSVLDPACGAGAFLVGAYHLLLRWYRDLYLGASPYERPDALREDPDGVWHLTTGERRRILLAHIHGVDNDPRAIELAWLTLAIAAHAGEATDFAPPLDFSRNLRCGDALIAPDIRTYPAAAALTAAEIAALRPFDWQAAFPAIMARGGFDAVLGNPPYLSYAGRQAVALAGPVRAYLLDRYGATGWPAAHTFFIARAVRDLARRRCAFIVPDQVGHLAGYASARALLARHSALVEVRYWGDDVFADAITPALTFVADQAHDGPTLLGEPDGTADTVTFAAGEPWRNAAAAGLLAKLRRHSVSLGALVADPGVHTGNCAHQLIAPRDSATSAMVPVLEGRQIGRYRCDPPARALRPDYATQPGEYCTIRPLARYADAPFVIRQTAPYPIVGPRLHATYFRNSLLALYPPPPADGRAVEYLVGLLNSSLLRHAYTAEVREARQRAFPQVKVGSLRQLPIRHLDLKNPQDRAQHDAIAGAVRRLLALHAQQAATMPGPAHDLATRTIAALDRALDRLVYELYELTDDEIAMVEG